MRRPRPERLLGGVHHVQEAVAVLLALVHLGDGRGDAHHAVPVHQQEEGLVGVELQAPPDDFDELAHVHVVGYKELGFIQDRKLLLTLVSFYYHLRKKPEE